MIQIIAGLNLAFLQSCLEPSECGGNLSVRYVESCASYRKQNIRLSTAYAFCDESVEPSRVAIVLLERVRFQKGNEVFDGCAEISPNIELLQSHNQIFPRLIAILAPGKAVPELRVGKLVKTSTRAN